MKRALIVVAVLFLAGMVTAQDAKVELLTPQETAQAKQAYDNLQKAQAEVVTVKDQIKKAHLTPGPNELSNCATGEVKWGWGCGDFDFSSDFKAIVPHVESKGMTNNCFTFPTTPLISN